MYQNNSDKRKNQKKKISLDEVLADEKGRGRPGRRRRHSSAFDLTLETAEALKMITVRDFYDEFFRRRYLIRGTARDEEVKKAHLWLSDVIAAMLGETDTKKLTMRELADRISAAVESPDLNMEDRMNYYALCHVLTDEMRLTDYAVLPGLDRTDEMKRYDADEDDFGSDLFSRAAGVRNRRYFVESGRKTENSASGKRSLDEILREAEYRKYSFALNNRLCWSTYTGVHAWMTARMLKGTINLDLLEISCDEANEFKEIVNTYTDNEWRLDIPFTQFAGQLSDGLICAKREEGLSIRTMEHYELCYQFIMLMASESLRERHVSLMRARGAENYLDYYERQEAEIEAAIAMFEEAEQEIERRES